MSGNLATLLLTVLFTGTVRNCSDPNKTVAYGPHKLARRMIIARNQYIGILSISTSTFMHIQPVIEKNSFYAPNNYLHSV
jgi:hypothetical protein